VLLDTHVWIWAADGGAKLGPKTRRRLARSQGYADERVAISVASVFEVVALHTAGRLRFSVPVERWIRDSIERGGLQVLDLERDVAVDAGMIPASALADPIDRWLVATARDRDRPLVTSDRKVLEYGARTGLVRVVDASR
jgi:PIN domain nuclease of toxin-antitoxin system